MAPRLPMAPRKVPVIGFGRAMVGSLVWGGKMKTQQKIEREWWFGLRWPKLHGKTQQPAESQRLRRGGLKEEARPGWSIGGDIVPSFGATIGTTKKSRGNGVEANPMLSPH